jgi:hypothetical protein
VFGNLLWILARALTIMTDVFIVSLSLHAATTTAPPECDHPLILFDAKLTSKCYVSSFVSYLYSGGTNFLDLGWNTGCSEVFVVLITFL